MLSEVLGEVGEGLGDEAVAAGGGGGLLCEVGIFGGELVPPLQRVLLLRLRGEDAGDAATGIALDAGGGVSQGLFVGGEGLVEGGAFGDEIEQRLLALVAEAAAEQVEVFLLLGIAALICGGFLLAVFRRDVITILNTLRKKN